MENKQYKKCKKCGSSEQSNSDFCSKCGASLNYLRKRYTIVIGTLICILVIMGIISSIPRIAFLLSHPQLPGLGMETYLPTNKVKKELTDKGCKWQEKNSNEDNLEKYIVVLDKTCPYEAEYIAIKNYDTINKYSERYIKYLMDNESHMTDDRGTMNFDITYRKHVIDGDYYGVVCWNKVNLFYLRTDKIHKKKALKIIENLGCA